jgi:HPt (histidine-containing phosphotransfer) domain-containing protein
MCSSVGDVRPLAALPSKTATGDFGMNTDQHSTTSGGPENASQAGGLFALHNISLAEALARFGGDQARYQHWLREFVEHGPAATAQIRQAIASGSSSTAVALVHALKGRTGMLGMTELHSISLTLEKALHNGEPPTLWLEELELSVSEMSRAIAQTLGKAVD